MRTKYLYMAGLAALLAVACNDSDYKLENLVPDEYHKVLYINNSGTQDLILYDTGKPDTCTVSVYKGGSDPSLTASAVLGVHTQEETAGLYGENCRVIPSESYSLGMTQLDFASGERYKTVAVSLQTGSIGAVMEKEPDADWVLPLYLYSEQDSVNANKSELLIRITEIVTPSVGFIDTKPLALQYTYGFSKQTVGVGFGLDTDNSWDIDCQFAADPSYVETYNAENGTSYALLPEDSYSLEENVTLPAGSNTADLNVTIDGSGLNPGDYLLPVRMTDVSLFKVSGNALCPLIIRVIGTRFDRSDWFISANTQELSGEGEINGRPTCMIDDDILTYWHSQWKGGKDPLPHEITVDVKKEVTFTHFGLIQRQGNNQDVGEGEFFVSSDNESWTSVGTFNAQQVLEEQIFTVTPTKGKYFKVRITQSNRNGNSSLAELYAYGIE